MSAGSDLADPFDLQRFLLAQEEVFETALRELERGRKESHWMWFIFPQIDGLGSSVTAKRYAIKSKEEALAYLEEPLLRDRLHRSAQALLRVEGKSALQIMGLPDDLKLRSSMTLFGSVLGGETVFREVIQKYFGGIMDEKTLAILGKQRTCHLE
ncbi:MAG: DUF1810 domain-containing protein [Chthoniobacterales bacterium]|nr:DUF1810 domain-containing protein [Chthoniobacterales bacterium]